MQMNVVVPGLNKLSRSLSEALTIETCSICLQKLEETVVLWPCAHWFCHSCIKKLHSNKQGKKVLCPLCNGTTTRRSVLPFEDKQKEYEDYLQTLIGAISLDLGFDVTSYNNNPNNEIIGSKCDIINNESPVKNTRPIPKISDKIETINQDSKRVTRSRQSKNTNNLEIAQNSKSCKPPKNYKEKKVKDWLIATRFSIGDQDPLSESVLENSNKTDVTAASFSEDHLKSVSQIDNNEDISRVKDGQEKQSKCKKPLWMKNDDHLSDQFDELLLKEKKSRFITTTYGNNCNLKSRGKRTVVDSDIFNTAGDSKNDIRKISDKSESTLEDFSSGSGEEWCIGKKKKLDTLNKSKPNSKGKRNLTKSWSSEKVSNMKAKKKLNSIENRKKGRKNTLRPKEADFVDSNLENNESISTDPKEDKSKCKKEFGESAKKIINEWDEISEANSNNNSKQALEKCDPVCTPLMDTTIKSINLPSPGWTRLTRTKKEFNVSERKKLSLKTLNKTSTSQISSISFEEASKISTKFIVETTTLNTPQKNVIDNIRPSNIGKGVNQSVSSTMCTPLKELETPIMNKKRERDSGICNESRFSSPERKRICRDAEVQTSPSQMQAYIKDYLKKTLGEEVEDLLSKGLKGEALKKLSSISCFQNSSEPKVINQDQIDKIHKSTKSQDSEKENVIIPDNSDAIYTDDCVDSDFILGTEEINTTRNKQCVIDCDNPKLIVPSNDKDMIVGTMDGFDPDAVTQLYYKTPVVPKQSHKTSTQLKCSVVSNPTDSELRKVNDIFLNNDTIGSDITPITTTTLWNDSGIVQLEKSTGKINTLKEKQVSKSEELEKRKYQNLKEKKRRSRRQLDFVEDSKSYDNDMFGTSAKNGPIIVEQLNAHNENGHFEGSQILPSPIKVEENQHKPDICSKNQVIQDDVVNDKISEELSRECSLETSQDCFVEGTPDESQRSVLEEKATGRVNEIESDNICEKSTHSREYDKKSKISAVSESKNALKLTTHQEPEQKHTFVDMNTSNTANCKSYLKMPVTSSEKDEEPKVSGVRTKESMEIRKAPNSETYTEENSDMTNNTEEVDAVNCFASSLLTGDQNLLLISVLNGLNIPYSKTVGGHISHLVVGTTNGCTKTTYKVLYAMALHKPIIRFEWVEHVLRTGGTTVSLDPFIALDPSGECGVLRARKDKKRELLCQFAIHVYNVIESIIKKEQMEELIRLCGGTVVSKLHQLQTVPRNMYRVIILSAPPESCSQGEWRQKYAAAEVSIDWIYNTIGCYRVAPVGPYMVEQMGAVQFLLHEGYPENLIFDPSMLNDSAALS